jgi:hypothetical protein
MALDLEEVVIQVEQLIDLDFRETEGPSCMRLDYNGYSCWVFTNGEVDDGHDGQSKIGNLAKQVVSQMLKE